MPDVEMHVFSVFKKRREELCIMPVYLNDCVFEIRPKTENVCYTNGNEFIFSCPVCL